MDLLKILNNSVTQFLDLFKVAVNGWKSFYLPAEPLFFAFNPPIVGALAAVNNQALDLRLPYAYYVYGIGRASTGVFSFTLKGASGGVVFMSANVRSDALWSVNEPVLWLRRPFKIAPMASLVADLTDISGAPNTIQIVLVGWKQASQYQSGQRL